MIFVLIFILLAIYIGYNRIGNNFSPNYRLQVITVLVTIPLVEEIVFRDFGRKYTDNIQYGDIINSVLFGLIHLVNYFNHGDYIMVFMQVISASYLGYYLLQFDNILYSYGFHLLYNTTIMSILALLAHYKTTDEIDEIDEIKRDDTKFDIFSNLRTRCIKKSIYDDDEKLTRNDYKYIKHINKDLKISIDSYDDKCKSRKYFQYPTKSLTDDKSTINYKYVAKSNMNKELLSSIDKFKEITEKRSKFVLMRSIPRY